MSVGLRLEVLGTPNITRGMESLMQHLGKDLKPMFEAIQSWWYNWQAEIFAGEGSSLGSSWAPLSEKYAKWKAKAAPGRPILELTGRLANAMAGAKSEGAWEDIKKREMRLGIEGIPYWAAHNFGFETIPQRKYIDTTKRALVMLDKDMQEVLADAKRKILGAMGGPGGLAR